jgi:HAE1 family hydrophobic/amphiphilic exporter-1
MIPILVRAEGASALREDQLPSLMISAGGAGSVPLASLAQLTPGQGPAEIRHLDGQRAAEVSAYASAFELGRYADEVREALSDLPLPRGIELSLAGQETEMSESATQLSMTLLLSLFLVFVVMATQFESVRAPLLIMGAVPLAGIGVIVGLWWTQTPLSVVVFVGMITLSGVVVNNAIVYIDAAQRAVGRGLGTTEALIQAGKARLRPILMTTLTTLIGLLPMLSPDGEGAELRAPLALTLIFGLGVSTLLILFVLPALSKALAPPRSTRWGEPQVNMEMES